VTVIDDRLQALEHDVTSPGKYGPLYRKDAACEQIKT